MAEDVASAAQMWSEWQRLATRSVRGQLALAQESWEAARRFPAGEAATSQLNRSYADAAWREAQRYWSEAVALGLDYTDGLVTLGQRSAARLLDQVTAPAGHVEPDPPPRRVAVDLAGIVGERVSTRITVANRQREPRRVTFAVSDMTGGGETFAPPISVSPDSLLLHPGEERDVELVLDLRDDQFAAGVVYHGEVRIRGGDNVILALEVRPT